MKKTILSLIAILFCLQSFGQTVRVGNGSTNNLEIPFFIDDSTSSFIQQIFTAQEINQNSRYIESIALESYYFSYLCNGNLSIYIGTTTQSSFQNEFISLDNTTRVFSRDNYGVFTNDPLYDFNDTIALSYIYFDRPYFLDGNSNLVITFVSNKSLNYNCHNDTLGYLSEENSLPLTRTAYLTYPNTFTIDSTPDFGNNSNHRNNIRFNFTTCPNGFNLNVSDITPNQARISWEENDTTSNWIIEYKLSSEYDWNNANNEYSDNNYIILDSLFENSDYNVRLRKSCNDTTFSLWSEISFRTICATIDTIPYYFDFSSLANYTPLCWGGNYYIYGGGVNLNVYDLGNRNYFISPKITKDINSLSVKFHARNYAWSDAGVKFSFGVMSDANDTNTFVSLFDTLILTNFYTDLSFYEINIDNNIVVGTNNHIAFRVEALGRNGAHSIGDVTIDYKLQCPNVYDFRPIETTHNSIAFSWNTTNNSHNGYQIAYSPYSDTFNPDSTTTIINLPNTSSLPFLISNLTPSTHYSFAIRQNCGGAWTIIDAYTMGSPAILPYSCDFETQEERDKWMFSNDDCINKWVFGQAINSGDMTGYSMYVSDNNGDSNTMNYYSNTVVTASRLFESNGAGGYTITFNSRVKGDYNFDNMLKVFVVDSNTSFLGTNTPYAPYYASKNYSDGAILFGGEVNSPYSYFHNDAFPYFYNNANPVVINSHTINIPYQGEAGTVKKLIFVWTNRDADIYGGQRYYPAAIDNITIQENPCAAPTLSVLNSYEDSVELNWTSGYSDSLWVLYYKPINSDVYSFINLDTTTFVLNCPNQIQYNTYVKVLCGNGNWQESNVITFSPLCKKITLPFIEDFNNYSSTSFPICWSKSTDVSLNNQVTYAPTNTLLLNNNTYVSLPELEDSIAISNTIISFKYRKAGTNSKLIIGVMETPNDLSTFDTVYIINTPSDYLWHRYEVNLNNYNGSGKYLSILSQNINRVDDIYVDYYNPCPNVYDFRADSITYSMVNLRWDTFNNQHQGYQISYLLEGDSLNNETIINVNEATINFPYQLLGLNPASYYKIGIRQNCGGNWSYINIKTKGAPATLPYYCDFSTETERYSWEISNGNAPNKWFIGQAVNQSPIEGYSLYVSEDNGLNNTYSVGYFSTGDKNSTVVASRLIELTGAGSYTLNFNSRVGGENNNDYIKVFLVDEDVVFTGSATSTSYAHQTYTNGVILFTGSNPYYCNPANPTTINNHTIQLPYLGVIGTIKKLIFVWTNSARNGTQPPAAIDNISFVANNCTVSGLNISNIRNTNALASWTSYVNDSSWYLYIKENDSINYDSIHITNNTSYTFTNLLPNTKYNVYLRLDCDSTLSEKSNIITFTTLCNPSLQIPLYEDFETYNSSNYIDCWSKINPLNNGTPRVYSGGYNSSYSLGLYYPTSSPNISSYAILPVLDTSIHINNLFMRFMMRGNEERLTIGIISDINDATSFDSITTISITEDSWVEKIVYFNNYVGNGHSIAFKGTIPNTYPSYKYIDIDNVYIDYFNNCFTPSNLSVTNIKTDSAELNWNTPTIPSPSYWLYYKKDTDINFDSLYVTSLPYNLSNLDHSTFYKFYVRSDCNNNFTNNSDTITFQTQCGKISSFPYIEDFDSYSNYGLNYPLCWSSFNNPTIVQDYYTSSPSSLMLNSNITTPHIVITPQIGENINLLKVRFKMKKVISLYGYQTSKLIVGVMSNKNDTNTFEGVYEVASYDTIMREYEVLFNSTLLTGSDKYIAFKTLGGYYNFRLDDIVIDYIPQCAQPTQLSISNIGSNHATINWLPSHSSDTAWYLYYKEIRSTTADSVYVNSIPYNLTGLNQVSTYDVYVKTVCSNGLSTASHLSQFITPCATISSIPFFENFDTVYWIETDMLPCWTAYSSSILFTNNSPPNGLNI
ncbi:MAG: fibronectin type III domain-containing protein, partial [Bacteroidales bacterium]|nr:fibronectin type III domain-containing protein [Bacteroidales bacterium]